MQYTNLSLIDANIYGNPEDMTVQIANLRRYAFPFDTVSKYIENLTRAITNGAAHDASMRRLSAEAVLFEFVLDHCDSEPEIVDDNSPIIDENRFPDRDKAPAYTPGGALESYIEEIDDEPRSGIHIHIAFMSDIDEQMAIKGAAYIHDLFAPEFETDITFSEQGGDEYEPTYVQSFYPTTPKK